jgi:hypothetical protein
MTDFVGHLSVIGQTDLIGQDSVIGQVLESNFHQLIEVRELPYLGSSRFTVSSVTKFSNRFTVSLVIKIFTGFKL